MTRKNLFAFSGAVFAALFATSVMAEQSNSGAGDFFNNSPESVAPAFHDAPKQSELPALNYVNQCLNCHSVEASRVTGATRISPTHFADRDGNIGSSSSPRRYFCLQCHVSQSDVEPIVPNEFKPMKGYGK